MEILMYIYCAAKRNPIGVSMRDEYEFKIKGSIPNYRFFTARIEASDIELLNELHEYLQDFIESKQK